jgi:hypothetical protein
MCGNRLTIQYNTFFTYNTLYNTMLQIIYNLLYFTEIGGKCVVNTSESEKIFRNLEVYRKQLKRKRKFKMEKINSKHTLIWRTS